MIDNHKTFLAHSFFIFIVFLIYKRKKKGTDFKILNPNMYMNYGSKYDCNKVYHVNHVFQTFRRIKQQVSK